MSASAAAPGALVSAGQLAGGFEGLAQKRGRPAEKPALRTDLSPRQLVQLGEVSWGIRNPETNKIYTFDAATWRLIELFDGTRTRAEILEDYNKAYPPGEGIPFQYVLDMEESLRSEKLLQLSTAERSLGILRDDRKRRADKNAEGVNPMYMMWHVWDPERFLVRTARYVRWLWTPPAVAVVCVLVLFTCWVFVEHFDTIWVETLETWAFLKKPFWDAVQFWLIFTLIGFFHELSHAYVCKFYGGQVHDIGIALFYFAPAFYCDTADSVIFPNKWHRLWVTTAGIYIESIMCVLGTALWVVTYPDTLAHELAYKTMLYTGVATLFFNVNPLIKIDGYFAVTDLLGMPLLREEAFAYLGAWIQRKIFRLNVPLEPLSRKRKRIYITYALLAAAYSGVVMSFIGKILLNVYGSFLPDFALALTLATLYQMFKKRVHLATRVVKLFYLDKKELVMSRKKRPQVTVALVVLALLLAAPWSKRTIVATVALKPLSTMPVSAPDPSAVATVEVAEGQAVRRGDVLLTLRSVSLDADVTGLSAEVERLTRLSERLRQGSDQAGAFQAEQKRDGVAARLAAAEERRTRLVLKSPLDGIVLTRRPKDLEGKVVRGGDVLLEVADCSKLVADVPVSERLLTDLAVDQAVKVQLSARPLSPARGRVVSISPATSDSARPEGKPRPLRAPERPDQFIARAEFENADGQLLPEMTGLAKIYSSRSSYLARAGRVLYRWLSTVFW